MPRNHLREMLEALRSELEHTRSNDVDERSRELLRGVIDDARSLVDSESADPEPQTLLESLRTTTRDFEDSHPALAAAVNRVAGALSNLGI
jgi:hypothetical protein